MNVDLEGHLPFLVANVADVLEGRLVRCIIDEDVDTAQLLNGSLDDRPAMLGTTKVASDEHSLATLLLDQRLDLLGVVVLIEIGDQDVSALARVSDRHGPTDAAVAAGDQPLLAGQFT
jgi:hypothetical protein